MDDGFAIVCHQTDERRIPLVDDLAKRRRAGRHQDLTNAVAKLLDTLV